MPYSIYRRKRSRKRLQAVIDHLPMYVEDGQHWPCAPRILDAGCNTGYFANGLAPYAREVVGIDRDPDVIDQAKAGAPDNVTYVVGDLDDVARLGQFDVVVCMSVLHHIIAQSPDYGEQRLAGLEGALMILRRFCIAAPVLFLEMGDHREARPWSKAMPPDLDVSSLLRQAGYRRLVCIDPPCFEGLAGGLQKTLHENFYEFLSEPTGAGRTLRNLLRFDNRDGRPIWQARR